MKVSCQVPPFIIRLIIPYAVCTLLCGLIPEPFTHLLLLPFSQQMWYNSPERKLGFFLRKVLHKIIPRKARDYQR